jgi:hypothetical protein
LKFYESSAIAVIFLSSSDLDKALKLASNKSCYFGIPCRCCNKNMANIYINKYNINPLYTTFANIFVNANWKTWVDFINENNIYFTLVGPYNNSKLNINNHIEIPELLVNDWDSLGEMYTAKILGEVKKTTNNIYFFSCGPIAKILIAHAWAEHPYNIYIDIGSSLDLFLKGKTNRYYINESHDLSQLVCKFDKEIILI